MDCHESSKGLMEYLKTLEANGKLWRIKRKINKDTELMPLVRWQFRGLPEAERRAFLFENVIDSKGREYKIPVAVGMYAASREIYSLGMQCDPKEIMERWAQAQREPIEPILVEKGPVQEEIHVEGNLLEHGGLDEFPIPISTPGFDSAPFFTAAHWVTKDIETGIRNMGNYRGHIKSSLRTGICIGTPSQHINLHWRKAKRMGKHLEAAIVLGGSPSYGYVATAKLPYGVDEFAVAGGLDNCAVKLVKCKTVDLEVPADADIVLEGIIRTDVFEPEAPFGEYTGYMGVRTLGPIFEVTCITHRKNAIYNAFISQFPPSESSKIRQIGYEAVYYKFLKYDCNISGVMDVAFHESSGSWQYCVIQMKKENSSEPWQALNCAVGFDPTIGKIIIVVDEDIDPRDADSVNWALSFRMQPHRDTRITEGKASCLDHSSAPTGPAGTSGLDFVYPPPTGTSALLIDATRKWAYPPVSLPKRDFMEKAKEIWEQEGLPTLSPKVPWHGYLLGSWSQENEEEAVLAVNGDYKKVGEKLAGLRIPIE